MSEAIAIGLTGKKMNMAAQDKSFKLGRFMDSSISSSLRQQQRFQAQRCLGKQFSLAVETVPNLPTWNTTFDHNRTTRKMNKPRERVAAIKCSKSPTTNAGNDAYSYSNNCALQEKILDSIKPLIQEEVVKKLDLATLSLSSPVRIVDMGCSTGPNTFSAVQNIIEAVETKVHKFPNKAKIPEIQVFFNDQATNDFNTLFTTLPEKYKGYYVAGVPGSFYGRIFPESSLHMVYSSCSAIPWLSQAPENKGGRKTYISNASNEVLQAYSNQCAKDMEKFLQARAREMVFGGLMFIVFPTRPNKNVPHSEFYLNKVYDTLGSCLVDMANKGVIDEKKLDSFKLPLYFASPEEVEESVMRNGYFNIERIECLPHQIKPDDDSAKGSLWMAKHIRAIIEESVKEHFGLESFDEIFDMFRKKLEEGYVDIMSGEAIDLFITLKRRG